LVSQGHEIRVITHSRTLSNPSQPNRQRIEVIRLPGRPHTASRYDLLLNSGSLLPSRVRNAISWSDLVYIPGGWYNALLWAKLWGKPTVVHMHNYSLVCRASLYYNFIAQKVGPSSLKSFMQHERIERGYSGLRLAGDMFLSESIGNYFNALSSLSDALVFVSDDQLANVVQNVPKIARKSYRVYNPIPDWPFEKCETKGIGYLGGSHVVKGSRIILQAAAMLNLPHDICLQMTGMGSEREFRIGGSVVVRFHPRLTRPNLASLMRDISIVCIPSLWPEPLPYSVIDAILYGKLVVASRIGGIPEIVNDIAQSTTLVDPGDSSGFAHSIQAFLQLSVNETNELGESSRERLRQRFDNGRSATALAKIMENVRRR
jgi:glycosyltransferase involved in cell wall biosynthesis